MSARRGAETPTGHASSVLFLCAVQRVATSHMWLFTLELIKIKYKFLKISSSHSLATFQVLHNLTLATISESTASQKDLWDSTTPGIFKFLLLQFVRLSSSIATGGSSSPTGTEENQLLLQIISMTYKTAYSLVKSR